MRHLSVLALLPLVLSGCNSWMGEKEAPPLPGERVAVLAFDQQISADPTLSGLSMGLPAVVSNSAWAVPGGDSRHSGGALALSDAPKKAWDSDIGAGLDDDHPLMTTPVIVGNTVYTMDSGARVTALNTENGKELWDVSLAAKRQRDEATGGGLAFAGSTLYASLGYGEVVALDPTSGKEVWRTPTRSPLRSAPTAEDGRVYVVTIDNQLVSMDAQTGTLQWVHSGIVESAGLLGAAAPAIGPDFALVAYSSGELYAVRNANGRELWSDNLSGARREGGVMSIAAIRGMPALSADGTLALAVSNSGRLTATDTRSGQRVWDQRMGGSQMPWIAGDTVFVVNNMAQLVALNLRDGRIRWVQQLTQWENPKENSGLIAWYGPVLAGNKLWLTTSNGRLNAYDTATGAEVSSVKVGSSISRPPVVANGTLYTLEDDATLTAWR